MKDEVSRPTNTTGNFNTLCAVIFTFVQDESQEPDDFRNYCASKTRQVPVTHPVYSKEMCKKFYKVYVCES